MKKSTPLFLISLLLCCTACSKGGDNKPAQRESAASLVAGSGPQATKGKVVYPPLPTPKQDETLYVAFIRNQDNLPVARARVMVLTEEPEGLYMRQPRRKTVAYEYRTPLHGRFAAMITSDGKPKFLWVGGDGFKPHIYALPAATGGKVHKMTCPVTIVPIAKLVIQDHQGYLVANAIVTFKAVDGGNAGGRGLSDNYGNTERSDDSGQVNFTRLPGKYTLIATKETGRCRLTKIVDFDGSPTLMTFKLPSK